LIGELLDVTTSRERHDVEALRAERLDHTK
jgi:hypothetical protein